MNDQKKVRVRFLTSNFRGQTSMKSSWFFHIQTSLDFLPTKCEMVENSYLIFLPKRAFHSNIIITVAVGQSFINQSWHVSHVDGKIEKKIVANRCMDCVRDIPLINLRFRFSFR